MNFEPQGYACIEGCQCVSERHILHNVLQVMDGSSLFKDVCSYPCLSYLFSIFSFNSSAFHYIFEGHT